jgi:hypothetical protein
MDLKYRQILHRNESLEFFGSFDDSFLNFPGNLKIR